MTVIPWPRTAKPRPVRKQKIDPLPRALLEALVADFPGPREETEGQRTARLSAHMQEMLAFKPEDAAQAMLAAQGVLMKMMASDARRDAERTAHDPALTKKVLRQAMQLDKLTAQTVRAMEQRKRQPPVVSDAALFRAFGLVPPMVDVDDPAELDQAVSGVIVPLHRAPARLQ